MAAEQVTELTAARERRRNVERALLLYRIDPARSGAAKILSRIMAEAGAESGAVVWCDANELAGDEPGLIAPAVPVFPAIALSVEGFARRSAVTSVTVGGVPEPASVVLTGGGHTLIFLRVDAMSRSWIVDLAGSLSDPVLDHARWRPGLALGALFCRVALFWRHPGDSGVIESAIGWTARLVHEHVYHGWGIPSPLAEIAARRAKGLALNSCIEGDVAVVAQVFDSLAARDLPGLAEFLQEWGEQSEARGNLRQAQVLYSLQYEVAIALTDSAVGTTACRRMGRTHRKMAEWSEALRWYGQAKELAQFDDDLATLGHVLVGIGEVRRDQGGLPDARERFVDALRVAIASGDPYPEAVAHQAIAAMDRFAGEMVSAARHAVSALRSYTDRADRARAAVELGAILMDAGLPAQADAAFDIGTRLAIEADTRIIAMDARGHIAALLGNPSEYLCWRDAVDAIRHTASPRVEVQLQLYEARSLAALGRIDDARSKYASAIRYAKARGLLLQKELAELDLEAITLPRPAVPDDEAAEIGRRLTELKAEVLA